MTAPASAIPNASPSIEWNLGGMTFHQRELSIYGEVALLNLVAEALPRLEKDADITLEELVSLLPDESGQVSMVRIGAVMTRALRVIPEVILDGVCIILRVAATHPDGTPNPDYAAQRAAITDGINLAGVVRMLTNLAEQNEVGTLVAPFERAAGWVLTRSGSAATPPSASATSSPGSTV